MAAGFHTIATGSHVAPPSAAVTALVNEQPSAIRGAALANSSQAVAGEQLCCAGKHREKNLLQPVGFTRPFPFDPVGVLVHTQVSGGLCQD